MTSEGGRSRFPFQPKMTDPSRPSPFSYPSHSSSDTRETDPTGDWAISQFSQTPVGFPVSFEAISGSTENPAGAFRTTTTTTTTPSTTGERSINAKVPIPRTTTSSNWTSSGRVSRACENCREQKAKCSGHRPTCQRCQEAGVRCSYGDRKREKMAKQLNDLTTQVQAYDELLRDIRPELDTVLAQRAEQVLNEFSGPQTSTPPSARGTISGPVGTAVASSLGAIDYIDEDYNRDEKVQALGFVGEHSEIAWLYRLKRYLDKDNLAAATPDSVSPKDSWDRHSVASVNFFLDDSQILVIDGVDLMQRPPQAVADKLVDRYFQIIHPSFPIIGKVTFWGQYKSFYSSPFVRPGKRWMAILNLIFALAARYSELAHESVDDTIHEDHVVYFSRAWKLSMSDVALLDHPNLQQVQVEGLTSFYLLSVGQINRSWRICGISIRSAVTMGLNLRNESNIIGHISKETRYRVWWSLYTLDASLCAMTGRPPSSNVEFCTTPLPVPFMEEQFRDETIAQIITDQEARNVFMGIFSTNRWGQSQTESSVSPEQSGNLTPNGNKQCEQLAFSAMETLTPNISLHFLYFVELGLTMRESVDTLYAPGAARKSWREVEEAISALNSKADAWLSKLPETFRFTGPQGDVAFERQISSLAFRYYSTKLIIMQPCLRHAARQGGTPSLGNFCDTMTDQCVDIATQMLALLPEPPDSSWLYHIAPWWCVLHYLMQAMTVLLTELFLRARPGTLQYRKVQESVDKGNRWLYDMSGGDACSQRAWFVCNDILSRYSPELAFQADIAMKN